MSRTMLHLLLLMVTTVPASSPPAQEAEPQPLVTLAQEFRTLLDRGQIEQARAMMTDAPRRWWNEREGEGRPWVVSSKPSGPWAKWDEEFHSTRNVVDWKQGEATAIATVRETNDYFRLLERGTVTSELVYFFDDAGLLEGLLIRAVGERPPGRTEEFLAWARASAPEELEALMPAGEIDPSGDHPRRFRKLLVRWRSATGLPPIQE